MQDECYVGDCIYFECSPKSPYEIGRIKEFQKEIVGDVLVKVGLYLRMNDSPFELMSKEHKCKYYMNTYGKNAEFINLSPTEQHKLLQRELFCSKKTKIIPAKSIKGKCCVAFLNEAESLLTYINSEDTFFYLTANRSKIRVGFQFQADIPKLLDKDCDRNSSNFDGTLLWSPDHGLSEYQLNYYMKMTKLIETISRSCYNSEKITDLISSAAAASRDAILQHGLNVLHQNEYKCKKAENSLYHSLNEVKDDIDQWSDSEANLFELGYKQYKKDFLKIRLVFLPWKSVKNIVKYYYTLKTTDNYLKLKNKRPNFKIQKIKILKQSEKLFHGKEGSSTSYCEECKTPAFELFHNLSDSTSQQICYNCWVHWRKYGNQLSDFSGIFNIPSM